MKPRWRDFAAAKPETMNHPTFPPPAVAAWLAFLFFLPCPAQDAPPRVLRAFQVPVLTEALHLRVAVGEVLEADRVGSGLWLAEEGQSGRRAVPVVVGIRPDGTPDPLRLEALVTVAPRPGAIGTRRFRLEPMRPVPGEGLEPGRPGPLVAGGDPRGWPGGRVPTREGRGTVAGGSRPGLSFREPDARTVSLAVDGRLPVFDYRHGTMLKPGVPADRARSSYLHPLYGLDGEVLTDDFPEDHHHHRGVFWSWPHVGVGGREYDLWMLKGIGHRFERFLATVESGPDGAVLGIENSWVASDLRVMWERIWITTYPEAADGRAIDLDCTWIPEAQPVTLAGAEGKSYGGMSIRYAPGTNTVITTPKGNGSEDLYITPLPWADLSRRWADEGRLSGAALMVAPDHPDYPPTWLTRHYGVLCLGWPGVKARTFPPGVPIHCRYRIWVHRGAPAQARLERVYQAYAEGLRVDLREP